MLTLALIRHGETDWNREGRVMGRGAVSLNETGRAQIARLAERLKAAPVRAVYFSPLTRTAQSAAILAASLGLSPTPDEGWIETKVTGWEGKLWSELAGHPLRQRYYTAPTETRLPEGEMFAEVRQRTVAAAEALLARHHGECVAVVTHADPIRAVISHYLGQELPAARYLKIDHATLSLLELKDGAGALRLLNAPPELVRLPPASGV
ncbi:MAG: histidine phosphatase family protein [Nitrospirota bacterium]